MIGQTNSIAQVSQINYANLAVRSAPLPAAQFTNSSPLAANGSISIQVSIYTQTNPAWSNAPYPYGKRGNTVGRIGCTLTTIGNALNAVSLRQGLSTRITPLDVTNRTLNYQSLLRQTQTTDLLNTSGKPVALGDTGTRRAKIAFDVQGQLVETAQSRPTFDRIRASLRAGNPVLIGIEGNPRRHTVLAYGIDAKGNFLVVDPDPHRKNPTQTTLSAVMKEWNATEVDMAVQFKPK